MINSQGSFFAKYAIVNLFSQVAVVFAGLYSVPYLVNGLGSDRFGALTLVWALTGYFGIFDFGLSRAVTKFIGERFGKEDTSDLPDIVGSSLMVATISGVVLGSLFMFFGPNLVSRYLIGSAEVFGEVRSSVQLLAISIPIIIISNFSRGILEGFQRFDILNYIRIPAGIGSFLIPVAVLSNSDSFKAIVLSLVVIRAIEMITTSYYAIKEIPNFFALASFSRNQVTRLLSFGGWISLINTIGPFLNYFDRFLIGYLLSVSAVTYYSIPFDLCLRLSIIPSSIVGVLFAAFSALVRTDSARITTIVAKSLNYTFYVIFPVGSLIALYSYEILDLWIGVEVAANSYRILEILSVSTIIGALSYIPSALIQAAGHPGKIGRYLLIVAISYIGMLYFITPIYGLKGVALAFLLRSLFDTTYYLFVASKYLIISRNIKLTLMFYLGLTIILVILLTLPLDVISTSLILLVLAPAYLIIVMKDVGSEIKKGISDIKIEQS